MCRRRRFEGSEVRSDDSNVTTDLVIGSGVPSLGSISCSTWLFPLENPSEERDLYDKSRNVLL